LTGRIGELPVGDAGVGVGEQIGRDTRYSRGHQQLAMLRGRNGLVSDLLSRGLGQHFSEFGVTPGHVAAQLVRLVLVAFAGQNGDGGRRVVRSGRAGHASGAGAADEYARLGCLLDLECVVIRVQVVAKEGIREARIPDDGFGQPVRDGRQQCRGVGMTEAGVGELSDSRLPGGLNHSGVLGY